MLRTSAKTTDSEFRNCVNNASLNEICQSLHYVQRTLLENKYRSNPIRHNQMHRRLEILWKAIED